ncbi:hypothetical protein C8J56DRAFT_770100 [Mycena floridula]|nr:hypothetical protein C8J56DRAFT_770100 [Mycena floridula]
MSNASLLDVSKEITLDHNNVRDLFSKFKEAPSNDEKERIANTLIREMAIHSDAEEISVYNDLGHHGFGDIASHNREEHAEVKKLVYAADDASLDQTHYDEIMARAVNAFLDHAQEEETELLPKFVSQLSPEENDAIARNFLKARIAVPSRPHPWAPVSGGVAQKAAGLQGKFHDKVIETLGGRKFTDLKYLHPEI